MEDVLIVLIGIAFALVIAVISLYNHLDRYRYRLDIMIRRARPALDEWADICESLHPHSADAYRRAKRDWKKMEYLQQMAETVKENNEEKLELQEQLLEFCYQFRIMAEKYNEKLNSSLFGAFYRLLGFKPCTILDFYPNIQTGGAE